MNKILSPMPIFLSLLFLLASAEAQTYDQEVVGTVTCPPCVAKTPRRVDLTCARACFSPKKDTDTTKTTNSEPGQSPVADIAEGTNATPPKPANTDVNLVIVTDDHTTITVDNPEKLKSHLAHRVAVTGYWITKGSFHIISVRTL